MGSEVLNLKLRTGITAPCLVQGDAAAILDALNVPSAAVVGSSSGGYVAQQLAVVHPEKVTALVLAGSPLSLHGRTPFADEVDALTDPIDEGWVRDSLSWFPLLHDVPQWFLEDRVRDGLRMPAHAWKAILHGLGEATADRIGHNPGAHTEPVGGPGAGGRSGTPARRRRPESLGPR